MYFLFPVLGSAVYKDLCSPSVFLLHFSTNPSVSIRSGLCLRLSFSLYFLNIYFVLFLSFSKQVESTSFRAWQTSCVCIYKPFHLTKATLTNLFETSIFLYLWFPVGRPWDDTIFFRALLFNRKGL